MFHDKIKVLYIKYNTSLKVTVTILLNLLLHCNKLKIILLCFNYLIKLVLPVNFPLTDLYVFYIPFLYFHSKLLHSIDIK